MDRKENGLQRDPWSQLQAFTGARIALGRAGISLTTQAHLDFQLAHARAKDAVRLTLNIDALEARLQHAGVATLRLNTLAVERSDYLQDPTLGRRLAPESANMIRAYRSDPVADIALVVADGLSSIAIKRHAVAFLQALMPLLAEQGYTCSPIVLIRQGRVAVADEVAEIMHSRMAVILIGERPGLGSPDSMGIYFTYNPHVGCRDSMRNCISNIHDHGLSYGQASAKLIYLVTEADRLGLSGVHLKDESTSESSIQGPQSNFLLE